MEIPLSDRLRQSNNAINLTCSTTKKLKFFGGEATQVIAAPVRAQKNIMEPHILLAQLRSLLEREPDLEQYSPTSKDHMTWLAQGHALVSRWNTLEAISFQSASDFLSMSSTRQMNIGKIFGASSKNKNQVKTNR